MPAPETRAVWLSAKVLIGGAFRFVWYLQQIGEELRALAFLILLSWDVTFDCRYGDMVVWLASFCSKVFHTFINHFKIPTK